jgi:hypothetical protein
MPQAARGSKLTRLATDIAPSLLSRMFLAEREHDAHVLSDSASGVPRRGRQHNGRMVYG